MRRRYSRILDSSALIALFRGNKTVHDFVVQAEAGWWNLLLPTTCIADAEHEVRAGASGWEFLLLTPGVLPLPLAEHAAIEMGAWPGSLAVRHAAHEHAALRAVVVTTEPEAYRGMLVATLPV